MNRHSRLNPMFSATIVATSIALISGVSAIPQPAHADWRSLSGGFLPMFTNEVNFQISPDSRTVVFIADKDTDDVRELYAVPITGGTSPWETTPLKLNPPLVAGGDVRDFKFTTDGQHVIYLADQDVDEHFELYREPVGGGTATKLNAPLVAGGNVLSFKIAPNTGRIAYVADGETNEVFELWSISGMGGGLFKLSGAMIAGGDIGIFEIDPLSDRAVFSADRETDGIYELYSTPMLGGTPAKLNPPIPLQGSGIYNRFFINPVIPVVAFVVRGPTMPGGKVYSNATAGGLLNAISFDLTPEQRILGFRISPAGDRVVFNVGTRSGSTIAYYGNLYSELIGGPGVNTLKTLTEDANPLFGVGDESFRITPDGKYVVYNFQKNAASQRRLESSVTASGLRAPLYTPSVYEPEPGGFDFSPNSQSVIYQTTTGDPQSHVYTIPPAGGSPTHHGVRVYRLITPDSSHIVYTRIVSDATQTTDLFSAQIFGGDERNLSGMNEAGYVRDVRVSKDSKWIVYTGQVDGKYDLRVSDGNPAQPPITPTPTAPTTRSVHLPVVVR